MAGTYAPGQATTNDQPNLLSQGDAGAPAGYLDAVAWLLTKQAEITWKAPAELSSSAWPTDDAARNRLDRCQSVDEELAVRFRRIVFDLDLDVQTRILSRWALSGFFLGDQSEASWTTLLVGALLRYRCAAALAYEWIDSSYGPCRRDAERVWRLTLGQAHDTLEMLSNAAAADPQELQSILDGSRDDVNEVLPVSEPAWQCQLIRWGLRRRLDDELREEFQAELKALLRPMGLHFSLRG